ncbi:MAG TPA: CHAT domain-containing protein [Candidatus Angelobacter sp.]|nr:CHAT domain-containing protein [Candidatus Angelobacter sp.]
MMHSVLIMAILLAGRAAQDLSLNQKVSATLSGAAASYYRLHLSRDEYVQVVAGQAGIDVRLTIWGPDRQKISVTDRVAYGDESASIHARSAGAYIIEVRAAERAARPGRYTLTVFRGPADEDSYQRRLRAEQLSSQIKQLSTQQQAPESRARAYHASLEALSLWRDLGDPHAELAALIQAGESCYAIQESHCTGYYEKALPLSQTLGDERSQGEVYNNLGMTEWQADDDPQKALENLSKAFQAWSKINYSYGKAAVLSNQSILLTQMGDYWAAIQADTQAEKLIRALGDIRAEAFIANNLGACYAWLGSPREGLYYLKRAVRLFRKIGDTTAAGRALLTISRIELSQGHVNAASSDAATSLKIMKAAGDHRWLIDALNVTGQIDQQLNRPESAFAKYSQALAEARLRGYLRGQASALQGAGTVHSLAGRHEMALERLEEALALRRRIGLRDGEASTLFEIARAERRRCHLDAAREWIEKALSTTESVRGLALGEQFRAVYLASRIAEYSFYIDLLMEMDAREPSGGFARQAFAVAERSRAQSLRETLEQATGRSRQQSSPDLSVLQSKLRRAMNFESARLMRSTDTGHVAEQTAASIKLKQLFDEYERVEAGIGDKIPRYANPAQTELLDIDQLQKDVISDDETVLLEYALGEKKSYVWAVTRNSFRAYPLAEERLIKAEAQRVIKLSQERFPAPSRQEDLKSAAGELSRLILQPIEQDLRGKRMVLIVGDDTLQLVPFALLPSPGGPVDKHGAPLIARYAVATLPSAVTLAILRREPQKTASRQMAIFADPVFDKGDARVQPPQKDKGTKRLQHRFFRRLLASRREAREISVLLPSSLASKSLSFAASKGAFLDGSIGTYRIIHIATHGLADSVNPELSGLVFSLVDRHGRPQDGILRLYEIYDLRLSADLVTLSACGSFQGEKINGEGIIGLTRGFIYAGAKTVIGSLWQVDDTSTAELMIRFYRGLLGPKHLHPAAALREAQASMWKEGWLPYHWAGFILQGEWQQREDTDPSLSSAGGEKH